MITGQVSGRHVLVSLPVLGTDGQARPVEFRLDTGFVGFLTLPNEVVDALVLPYISPQVAYLADGSRVILAIHAATVLWNGEQREVEVLASGGRALLGMSLLDGNDIYIRAAEGGLVTIAPF